MRAAEAVLVLQGHQCDVTRLVWLEDPPWGPVLYSGGGDGKVTTWNLNGNAEDFALWAPASGLISPAPQACGHKGSKSKSKAHDAALSAFEPSFDAAPMLGGRFGDKKGG